jgi:hypothetical protein
MEKPFKAIISLANME